MTTGRHRASSVESVFALFLLLILGASLLAPGCIRKPDADAGLLRIREAVHNRESGFMVTTHGTVDRVLGDDEEGSRHQRFILAISTDLTLLVNHNIDLAERVPVRVGDSVEVRGQYEWNSRGGVLHWTHRDPDGKRDGGWIRHGGREFR